MEALLYLLLVPASIAGVIACLLVYLLFLYPRTRLDTLPAGPGASGPGFEIHEAGGVPYLMTGKLPYPTHFESTNHPTIDLGGKWHMHFDRGDDGEARGLPSVTTPDSGWMPVSIPSTYNNAYGAHTMYEGAVWFHRQFRFDGRKSDAVFARLCFQGVLLRCSVWLNGRLLGRREGGYTPFYFDISDHLNYDGINHLVVKTDNRLTWTSLPPKIWKHHHAGWHTYGGIYRDVSIELVPSQYIFKGAASSVTSAGRTDLRVDVLVHNMSAMLPFDLACSVYAPGGKRVGAIRTGRVTPGEPVSAHRFDFRIDRPITWSPESPRLYTVRLSIRRGSSRQNLMFKTGIRDVSVSGTSILLNGTPVFLKGICKHEDDPRLGATQNTASIARDLSLVRRLNANYIRLAHYPHSVDELIAARDVGILLSEEIANYQTGTGFTAWHEERQSVFRFPVRMFGMRQMMKLEFLLNAQREIAEMIERDRNNPAIIMWSVGNETYTLFGDGGRVYAWLRDVARGFDPGRPVTMAELTYDIPFFDNRRRAAGEMDVISVNMYCGWYYGDTAGIGPHLDRLHRMYPDRPIIISEFGADSAPGRKESDGVWKAERVGYGKTYSEEYQARIIAEYWKAARERPFVTGVSPWVFSDFFCTWFPNNPVPFFNLKGILSAGRKPKAAYHLLGKLYGGK